MITLDFDTAIAIFLSSCILVVFAGWIIYTLTEKGTPRQGDLDQLVQCPFCSYMFYNYSPKDLVACPQCHSYIKQEPSQEKSLK